MGQVASFPIRILSCVVARELWANVVCNIRSCKPHCGIEFAASCSSEVLLRDFLSLDHVASVFPSGPDGRLPRASILTSFFLPNLVVPSPVVRVRVPPFDFWTYHRVRFRCDNSERLYDEL